MQNRLRNKFRSQNRLLNEFSAQNPLRNTFRARNPFRNTFHARNLLWNLYLGVPILFSPVTTLFTTQYTAVTIEHRGNAKETPTITRVLLITKKHQIVWANKLRRTSAAGCIVGGGRTLGSENAKETKKLFIPTIAKILPIIK